MREYCTPSGHERWLSKQFTCTWINQTFRALATEKIVDFCVERINLWKEIWIIDFKRSKNSIGWSSGMMDWSVLNVLTLSFLWSKQQSTTVWCAWQSDMIPLEAETLSTLTVNTQQSTARMDGNLSIVKEAEANYCWATHCYLKSGRTTCRYRRGYQALKFVLLGDAQLICKEDASHWILDWLSTLDAAHKVTVRWSEQCVAEMTWTWWCINIISRLSSRHIANKVIYLADLWYTMRQRQPYQGVELMEDVT